jgi:glycosyltransferase involved in cell wall biosynthesis
VRICHVSPHLPPDQGANALLPAELGRWAADRKDAVAFVAHPPAQGGGPAATLAGPIRWIPRRQPAAGLARALRLDSWRTARAVSVALDASADGADLLHLHSNGLIIEAAASWARRRHVPAVVTLYGTEIWHYRRRRPIDLFTRAYRSASAVTFYSRGLLERARELGLDRPHLRVIYPPVAEVFSPRDPAARRRAREVLGLTEPIVFLNVKRLHQLAGQHVLIDAFARIARGRDDVRLVICGTGPLRGDLEAQARTSGVAANVTFTGLVPNAQIAEYAAAADLFVLPSLLEALPTVAVEALASGTPVVSADHPGGLELHQIFGDDLRVVPRGDADRLAAALADALAAPRRTSARTDALVKERFRRPAVEKAYWDVYGDVTR